jgi:hypothetical protein
LRHQQRLCEASRDVEYCFTNFRTVTGREWSKTTKFDTSPNGYWELRRRDVVPGAFVIDEPMFERLLTHQPIFPSTVMMKRTFFEEIGRWNELLSRTPSEDLEFTLRCVSRAPIGVVSAPVVGIRKHSSNLSADVLRTTLGEIEILRQLLASEFAPAMQHKHTLREQIIIRSASAAACAFASRDVEKARELLRAVPWVRRSWKLQLKGMIANCPKLVARAFLSVRPVAGTARRR